MPARVVVMKEVELPVEAMGELVTASSREGFRFAAALLAEWKAQDGLFGIPVEGVLLAWESSLVVGVCAVRPAGAPRTGQLDPLYVLPSRRRRGVGRELVRRAFQSAQRRYPEIVAKATSPTAGAFLEAVGFARERPGQFRYPAP